MFRAITEEMANLYERKNKDYGNSFSKIFDEYGLMSSAIRLEDKLNRFKRLIDNDNLVKDESIRDTLIDMANYCILTVMEMDKKQQVPPEPKEKAKNQPIVSEMFLLGEIERLNRYIDKLEEENNSYLEEINIRGENIERYRNEVEELIALRDKQEKELMRIYDELELKDDSIERQEKYINQLEKQLNKELENKKELSKHLKNISIQQLEKEKRKSHIAYL